MHRHDQRQDAQQALPRTRRELEVRLQGVNACLAAFAHRPQDLRKIWLTEGNIPAFKQVLAWCVTRRIGYRVVETDEIERLTASSHHEGVCFALRKPEPLRLDTVLAALDADSPALLVWLHGVGNPHNLGAILRSAAHFGVGAVLLSDATALSPAAYRVAEGGADAVQCVPVGEVAVVLASLRRARFKLAATTVRAGQSLYAAPLPERLALLLGAESTGLPQSLLHAADLSLRIPGTGAVESLNVSVATALLMGEWARVHSPAND